MVDRLLLLTDKLSDFTRFFLRRVGDKEIWKEFLVIVFLLSFVGINFVGANNISPRIIGNIIALNELVIFPTSSLIGEYYNSKSSLLILLGWALAQIMTIKSLTVLIFTFQILISFIGVRTVVYVIDRMLDSGLGRVTQSCISCFFIFTACSLSFPDYPVLFVSQHTFGGFQTALLILFAGFFIANKTLLASFLLPIIFLTHPVSGVIASLFLGSAAVAQIMFKQVPILTPFVNGDNYIKHCLISGFLLSAAVIFWVSHNVVQFESLGFFQTKIDNGEDFYSTYIESHRTNNISPLFLLVCVSVICVVIFSNSTDQKIRNRFLLICMISLVVYCLKPFYPELISSLMLNRIALIPSILLCVFLVVRTVSFIPSKLHTSLFLAGTSCALIVREVHPLVCLLSVCVLFLMVNKAYELKANLTTVISVGLALSFVILLGLTASLENPNYFLHKLKMRVFPDTTMACKNTDEVEARHPNGLFVTTSSLGESALICLKLPILVDPGTLDIFSYFPHGVKRIEGVLDKVYGINKHNFREEWKLKGGLKDQWYRQNWESRSYEDWKSVAQQYKFNGVIVPEHWKLKLKCSKARLMKNVNVCYL